MISRPCMSFETKTVMARPWCRVMVRRSVARSAQNALRFAPSRPAPTGQIPAQRVGRGGQAGRQPGLVRAEGVGRGGQGGRRRDRGQHVPGVAAEGERCRGEVAGQIGEGTHTVIMEKNRMQLFVSVQQFLDEKFTAGK